MRRTWNRGMNRGEKRKMEGQSWLSENKPPPCLWLTSCHCDIFFPSLSHSTDTQMNQPRHRLMAHCHLCIMSPFISAPYNISHRHTQSICPAAMQFKGHLIKWLWNSQIQTLLTTSSNSHSCSSTQHHWLSRFSQKLLFAPPTPYCSPLSHFLFRLCPFPLP